MSKTFRHLYASPLGRLTLASNGQALTGLWMEGQLHFPPQADQWPTAQLPVFRQAETWLDEYFSGHPPLTPLPPLAPAGTPFQQAVWQLLLQIPWGATVTYGSLARQLAGKYRRALPAAQAIGHAVGRNPLSIIIPCHRVVGIRGQLTGYAGGLARKQWLLEREGALSTPLPDTPPTPISRARTGGHL